MSQPDLSASDALAVVRAAATQAYPPREAPSRHVICGTCHQVRGRAEGAQWCICPTGAPPGRPLSTAWVAEVELCRCCAAEAVPVNSQWAHWFCDECLVRVRALNQALNRCVVPVGFHPLVNEVVWDPGRQPGPVAISALSDQVLAFLEECGGMEEYAAALVGRTCTRLGFPEGADIDLDRYLASAHLAMALGVLDKEAAFAHLAECIGVPPD